jgi:hypothetical protein
MEIVKRWRKGKRVRYESREWTGEGYYSLPNGRSYIYIRCPYCGARVRAHVWSLAGSGKNCLCGAEFASFGCAYKEIKKEKGKKRRIDGNLCDL